MDDNQKRQRIKTILISVGTLLLAVCTVVSGFSDFVGLIDRIFGRDPDKNKADSSSTAEVITTEEPTTEEPTTEEPTTEEPATEEPATEEPATENPFIEVPDVEEKYYETARELLEWSGLGFQLEYETKSAELLGHVIRTDPPAGTQVEPNTVVTAYVSADFIRFSIAPPEDVSHDEFVLQFKDDAGNILKTSCLFYAHASAETGKLEFISSDDAYPFWVDLTGLGRQKINVVLMNITNNANVDVIEAELGSYYFNFGTGKYDVEFHDSDYDIIQEDIHGAFEAVGGIDASRKSMEGQKTVAISCTFPQNGVNDLMIRAFTAEGEILNTKAVYSGENSMPVSGAGSQEIVLALIDSLDGNMAQIGTYQVDFEHNTYSIIQESIPDAFEGVGRGYH